MKVEDKQVVNVGWFDPNPTRGFALIKNYVAFYISPMDACYVDGEKVTLQMGTLYGVWITKDITGPFKGAPGTWVW